VKKLNQQDPETFKLNTNIILDTWQKGIITMAMVQLKRLHHCLTTKKAQRKTKKGRKAMTIFQEMLQHTQMILPRAAQVHY
jgi:hypothetical protein